MQKSSVVKYSLAVALFMLLAAIIFIPSRFPAQSQGSFTPTPTTPPLPVTIESDSGYVSQSGQWASQVTSSASGGSYLYSSGSVDDTLTLEFEGTTVTIIYVEGSSLGTFAIEIDNTVVRTVITTSSTTNYNVQAVVDYLSAEHHTLKVYPTQGVIAVDAFYTTIDAPQLDLSSQTPPPTEGEGGASGAENGPDGGVWANWAEGDFDFDAIYAPTSGCPDPDDVATRDSLLAGGLYAEVDTADEFEQAIQQANNNQTQSPFLICITTLSNITLDEPITINKSTNIYGQIGRGRLYGVDSFGRNTLITINFGAVVEMSHLYITDGIRTPPSDLVNAGGAIVNHGKLSIFDSYLDGNGAFLTGGAILNGGSLYVARTTFKGNGVANDTDEEGRKGSSGGAIHNDYGGVFIAHCDIFEDNRAYTAGAAILNGFHDQSSILHIWRSAFWANTLDNPYYFNAYGDILNGQINGPYGNDGPWAVGSNVHHSGTVWAGREVAIVDPSTIGIFADPICTPLSPPRQTYTSEKCVLEVNLDSYVNVFGSDYYREAENQRQARPFDSLTYQTFDDKSGAEFEVVGYVYNPPHPPGVVAKVNYTGTPTTSPDGVPVSVSGTGWIFTGYGVKTKGDWGSNCDPNGINLAIDLPSSSPSPTVNFLIDYTDLIDPDLWSQTWVNLITARLNIAITENRVHPDSIRDLIKNASENAFSDYNPALAALYAIAFADAQGVDAEENKNWKQWEDNNIEPFVYYGSDGVDPQRGGNCATFVSASMFAGGAKITHMDDTSKGTTLGWSYHPSVTRGNNVYYGGSTAWRGVSSLASFIGDHVNQNLTTQYVYRDDAQPIDGYTSLRPGDLIFSQNTNGVDAHVSIVVGWGYPKGGNRFYVSYDEALKHGLVSIEYNPEDGTSKLLLPVPFAVDHGGYEANQTFSPRPWTLTVTGDSAEATIGLIGERE